MNSDQHAASDERIGKLYMAAAMVLSGTIGWFVLKADQPVFNVVLFRCLLGTLGLSVYCACRGFLGAVRLSARQMAILILGAITLSANWCFLFTAYRLTSIGITTVAYNVQPFLLLIASFLFWRQRPSAASVAWLGLSFCGLFILAMPWSERQADEYLWGIACALAAALLYAASTLLTKALSRTMRPELIAVAHMFTGSLVFLPLADFDHLPVTVTQIGAIATLGFVHSTLMYVLLYGAYQKAATTSIAILGFIYPLTAVVVDFFAYGKVLSLPQAFGGALIVVSAACYAAGLNPGRWLRQAHASRNPG
jgi:drug/metabolite transporter (DMT)-like permease